MTEEVSAPAESSESQATFEPTITHDQGSEVQTADPNRETSVNPASTHDSNTPESQPEHLLPQFKDRTAVEKAYKELQSKHDKALAGFTGAPDGDYSFTPSEELEKMGYSFDANTEDTKAFMEFARNKNMSQETFQDAMSMVAQMQAKNSQANTDYILKAVDEYADVQLAEFGADNADKFKQSLDVAFNKPGVSKDGLLDIVDGIKSAEGLNSLMAIINNGQRDNMPVHAEVHQDSFESLRGMLKDIEKLPVGPTRNQKMKEWETRVRKLDQPSF